jgi:hypothetical protein
VLMGIPTMYAHLLSAFEGLPSHQQRQARHGSKMLQDKCHWCLNPNPK